MPRPRLVASVWLCGTVLTLIWGAGAFGSPYPWAYTPLAIASATLGLLGLLVSRDREKMPRAIPAGLACIAIAVILQLVALPKATVEALSPNASAIFARQDLLVATNGWTSHPLSIDPVRTRIGLALYLAFSLLFLGTMHALNRETAYRLARAVVVIGVFLAIIGIIQRATFNGKIYGFWERVQGGIPFGPFINRNHFAGWTLMGLPVALGYFLAVVSRSTANRGIRNLVQRLSTKQVNQAVLVGFAILVMALALVLTMSRSGMICMTAALLMSAAMTVRHQRDAPRRAISIGFLAFVFVVVVSWVGLDQIAARFAERTEDSRGNRVAIWSDTIRIVQDFWLTGTGLNTYGTSTLYYQTVLPTEHLREAHNDYLQLAAEGGLLLVIPVGLSIGALIVDIRRRLRTDEGSVWWIRMGATTGLLAIGLQSFGEFSLQLPGNAALFAVVAGIATHDGRRGIA